MPNAMILLTFCISSPALQDLLTESSGYLLDELFLDIALHFSDILTSKWQNSTDAIDTVCETLQVSQPVTRAVSGGGFLLNISHNLASN